MIYAAQKKNFAIKNTIGIQKIESKKDELDEIWSQMQH